MSYILDALKKSERERTVVRGLGFSDAGWRPSVDVDWVRWIIAGSVAIIAIVVAVVVFVQHRTAAPVSAAIDQPATPVVSASVSPAPTADTPAVSDAVPLPEAKVEALPAVVPHDAEEEAKFLEAMSPDFRKTVPAMTVNIHVYVPDEARRILYINNKPYHRGDEIPGGVKVEEIVPEGVVLRFQGQRFKLTRPS
jgi:hypothetical protein